MANNDQVIYNVAIQNGYNPTVAKLIVAQARLESSDYNSNVFKNNNNTSGMKFIEQPLASRGTIVPYNERSATCKAGGGCSNRDYYAKFNSVEDSAKDKIERLYQITRNGVTPDQLKNAKDSEEFALLLKKRNYYGFGQWNDPVGQKEIQSYAGGLRAKLSKIDVVAFVKENLKANPKTTIATLIVGVFLIGYGSYFLYKKLK